MGNNFAPGGMGTDLGNINHRQKLAGQRRTVDGFCGPQWAIPATMLCAVASYCLLQALATNVESGTALQLMD